MIVETFQTLALHISRASQAYDEIALFDGGVSEDTLNDYNKVKVIDSFIFRFIKIQDLMGNKLFREVLEALGEYQVSMSMLDVLDRLEQLELLDSAEAWMQYRNLRNTLTHEYPDHRDELLEGIGVALHVFSNMKNMVDKLLEHMQARHVL